MSLNEKEQKIWIRTTTGPRQISATVIGNWAVHPEVSRKGMAVTHVRTGLNLSLVAGSLSKRDAVTIARRLNVVPEDAISNDPKSSPDDGWAYVVLSIVGEVLGG